MGINGNWKLEGYTIRHLRFDETIEDDFYDPEQIKVLVKAPNGQDVGEAIFYIQDGTNLVPSNLDSVYVQEEHRRKGIASAMYAYAEKVSGLKVIPSDNRTELANKLWSQENRPFGNK